MIIFDEDTKVEYLYDEKINKKPNYEQSFEAIDYLRERNAMENDHCLVGIRIFLNNQIYHDFYSIKKLNYQMILDWKMILSDKLIQMDFHFYYEAIKKIGNGHFAKVYSKI